MFNKNINVYQLTTNGHTVLRIASRMLFSYKEVLLDYGAPPMFTATICVTDIEYIPPPVYYAAGRGHKHTATMKY